jgi:antitoxin (DNA-binding transcriptional repressor) of toxin-antitoxin stability system
MSEKVAPQQVSATEFKNHQGSWLKKVVEGARLALTRHGRPMASVEPAQGVLPLGEKPTVERLRIDLSEAVAFVDPHDLESLVGIAKSLNVKSGTVSVRSRAPEKIEDLHKDILSVSEKLDSESLEKFVNIVRSYAKENLREKRRG